MAVAAAGAVGGGGVDGALGVEAIRIQQEHQLSYRDAAIVAAALQANATELLTEDLTDGGTIRGLRIRNPLPNEP